MPDRRAPADLHEEYRRLLEGLRQVSADGGALRRLVVSPDPAIRTLALGGLFLREDPRDLPFIARLLDDTAPTLPLLKDSDRAEFAIPRSAFTVPQTVGNVARAMIASYLDASDLDPNRNPAEIATLFTRYWSERSDRMRTAGWFLVRMRRATRQTSPLRPQYRADIDHVLAEIDGLPPTERAWTLLFVQTGVFSPSDLLPDRVIVDALGGLGRDAVLRFLDGESPTDDPDLTQDRIRGGATTRGMNHFILAHAESLLTPGDAERVLRGADRFKGIEGPEAWIAAAARLTAMRDPARASDDLRRAITSTPPERIYPTIQTRLAVALWQVRGAAERAFLSNWIYETITRPLGNEAVRDFFGQIQQEDRPDTRDLLTAVVSDQRFEQAQWALLAPLLEAANRGLTSPIISSDEIYGNQPRPPRADHADVLARWRAALREYVARPR